MELPVGIHSDRHRAAVLKGVAMDYAQILFSVTLKPEQEEALAGMPGIGFGPALWGVQ